MLKLLFSSKARVEILKIFLLNPATSYYQRELEQQTKLPIRAIQRELAKLVELGLLLKRISGNRNYYMINKDFPIFLELKAIFLKTFGIGEALKKKLKKSEEINFAFIYGSYAKNQENITSDIDLFIVGEITSRKLSSYLSKVKSEFNREINFSLYSLSEFKKKVKEKNHFILSILKEPKIFILGDEGDFKAIIGSRKTQRT
ncbi:MAG: nucleotidyltransferase domain-containing protein [Candidatus Aminicenantia bacterium]